jgi:hypothetical protein
VGVVVVVDHRVASGGARSGALFQEKEAAAFFQGEAAGPILLLD